MGTLRVGEALELDTPEAQRNSPQNRQSAGTREFATILRASVGTAPPVAKPQNPRPQRTKVGKHETNATA